MSDDFLADQAILDEIKNDIMNHSRNAARSKQKAIGPSEIAHPCARRVGYRLLEVEKTNFPDPWFTIIGTAVHKWLEDCYKAKNKALGYERYLLEHRVKVHGSIGGKFDLFDTQTKSIRDWKVPGDSSIKRAKSKGSGAYSDQIAQYGLGLVAKGYQVDWVEIVYLPRNMTLRNAHIHREKFDPERARAILARHDEIKKTTKSHGIKALALLPTTESFCDWCPYLLPGSPDLSIGCPGHIERNEGVAA